MEVQWYLDRYRLRCLQGQHPDWSQRKLAEEIGYSKTWVQKWGKRFEAADEGDEKVLHSRSRARDHPPEPIGPEVVEEIIKIRDDPPEGLQRVPGPLAIRYYLGRTEALKDKADFQPPSVSTIWRVLDRHQRIYRPPKRKPEPTTRAEPMAVVQIDFKDVPGVKVETDKQQHQVETLNVVDTGTSILLDNPVRTDFNAETVIGALSNTFGQWGLPERVEFDRDPRFVGATTQGQADFPSALMRFLSCLGVDYTIHPPRRPDKNGFVERYNKTYKTEGIEQYLPETLLQVEDMNRDFRYHYNYQRPNQALTCGNKPPRVTFAELPTLPKLAEYIDPDRWLQGLDGHYYRRRIDASGRFQLGRQRYYVRQSLAKQTVLVQVDGSHKQRQVYFDDQPVKTLALKGLFEGTLPFAQYLALIQKEAQSEWRLYRRGQARYTAIAA